MDLNVAKPEQTDQTSKLPLILSLIRSPHLSEFGIFGALCVNGHYFCDTGEHNYNGIPKLPSGVYKCERGLHKGSHGMYYTYEVLNVPGHTGILFHPGNEPQLDSTGCIILGIHISNHLEESRANFLNLMIKINDYEEFILVVI
jgi:hypothetical protein